PEKAWTVGTTAHTVVAGAIGAADHDGEFRNASGRNRRHQLGAIARDATSLVFLADHEAGDVLQEHQRDVSLTTQLDEVSALQRTLTEQDAVIGDDADRIT